MPIQPVATVRPESLPVPIGKTERRALRSANSKTFVHAEKAVDGKEIRTCEVRQGAVCYRDDTGELRSIDTAIKELDGTWGVDWAPYQFRLHGSDIGFEFVARDGGRVSLSLDSVGGLTPTRTTPVIDDNRITFSEVTPGVDIVFVCLNDRVKTLRIVKDAKAAREFMWLCESDESGTDKVVDTLFGTDANGKELDLKTSSEDIDKTSRRITEAWTASDDNQYPVEIDPTVTIYPAVTADDGYEYNAAWRSDNIIAGELSGLGLNIGVRFPNVAIDSGVTVTSATFGMEATAVTGSGGAGTIYGRNTANPGQFGGGSDLPSAVSRTTASTAMSAVATTGLKTWTVTTVVQEVLNLARSSGDAVALLVLGTVTGGGLNYTNFKDYEVGGNIPYLSITYTSVAGGTAANLLLLGCG